MNYYARNHTDNNTINDEASIEVMDPQAIYSNMTLTMKRDDSVKRNQTAGVTGAQSFRSTKSKSVVRSGNASPTLRNEN